MKSEKGGTYNAGVDKDVFRVANHRDHSGNAIVGMHIALGAVAVTAESESAQPEFCRSRSKG